MLTQLRSRVPTVALTTVVVLVVMQQFADIPGGGRVSAGLQNAAHGPWFALVTYLLHGLLARVMGRPSSWITVGAAFTLAVITEALQVASARDAQWVDIAFDMLGAGAAIAFIAGRRGLAVGLVLVSLAPAMAAIATQVHRDAIFPHLVSMATPWRGGLLQANSRVEVTTAPSPWLDATASTLKLTFADTTWPGVSLPEPVPDWSGYDALEVDVLAPAPLPLTVSIRLENAGVDHVYQTFDLAGGANTVRMPFAELFDVANVHVTMVVIYSTRPYAGHVVYFGRIALTRN